MQKLEQRLIKRFRNGFTITTVVHVERCNDDYSQAAYKPAFKNVEPEVKSRREKNTHPVSARQQPSFDPSVLSQSFHSETGLSTSVRTAFSWSFPRACQSTSRPRATHVAEMRARRKRRRRRRIVPRKKMQQWRVLGLINSGACFGVLAVNKR